MGRTLSSDFTEQYFQLVKELKMLEGIGKKDKGLADAVRETKKSIERLLFLYVSNGCRTEGGFAGCFPELVNQYDPDSYDLLDEKIKVLKEIAKEGPDCDVTKVPGFEGILEKKAPKKVKLVTFD